MNDDPDSNYPLLAFLVVLLVGGIWFAYVKAHEAPPPPYTNESAPIGGGYGNASRP